MKAKQSKAQHTIELKQEAIRMVKSGQPARQVASAIGMPHQTLHNWLRADKLGKLSGAGERVVTLEQIELTRLRAKHARLKMERDVLKKATTYFAQELLWNMPRYKRNGAAGQYPWCAKYSMSVKVVTTIITRMWVSGSM